MSYAQTNKSVLAIDKNYNRINTIKKWIQEKEVTNYIAYDEGTDNKVTLFYTGNKLEKIKVILNRKDFKKETQYYFLNNELSFVIDKLTTYQKPNQIKNSKTLIDKLYFENGKLIHLIKKQDSGWDMPPAEDVYNIFKEEVNKIIKKD